MMSKAKRLFLAAWMGRQNILHSEAAVSEQLPVWVHSQVKLGLLFQISMNGLKKELAVRKDFFPPATQLNCSLKTCSCGRTFCWGTSSILKCQSCYFLASTEFNFCANATGVTPIYLVWGDLHISMRKTNSWFIFIFISELLQIVIPLFKQDLMVKTHHNHTPERISGATMWIHWDAQFLCF